MTAPILVSESASSSPEQAAVEQHLLSFPATMLTVGMLKNPCAFVFLVLAVSPFTAPFQTCADTTAAVVAPLNNENDPGSLVPPLVTKAGRLTVAVAPPAGLGVSYRVPPALFTPSLPPTSHIRHDSIRQTVLRV